MQKPRLVAKRVMRELWCVRHLDRGIWIGFEDPYFREGRDFMQMCCVMTSLVRVYSLDGYSYHFVYLERSALSVIDSFEFLTHCRFSQCPLIRFQGFISYWLGLFVCCCYIKVEETLHSVGQSINLLCACMRVLRICSLFIEILGSI